MTGPGAFRFLNDDGTLGAHGWDGPDKARLWRYNQHYFDDLNAEGAAQRSLWHRALIADWIAANPPGHGTGWEPYPTALRIVNWVKWALAGNPLDDATRQSLAVQTRWLAHRLEWHLLGNHLFANAKALVFAGVAFDGPEAEDWLATGVAILAREIPEQILPDGGQFELSPMYHALAVEDLLDLVNIARSGGRADLAARWAQPVPAMLAWLAAMTHPDGGLAQFNDTAQGIAPTTAALVAYARRLGFSPPPPPPPLCHLASSGYSRLSAGPAVLIADLARVGPDYLPGHAHADTLSFELSLGSRRVVVNGGTSVYGLGPERQRQRGTAAHATITLDGQDSSEVWAGFRVGRRARPFDVATWSEGTALLATGAHDGYRHLPGRPVHRRHWRLTGGGLTVTDRIEGQGRYRIAARFPLAPGLAAVHDGAALMIRDETGHCVLRFRAEGGETTIEPATWHPEFGLALSVACLTLQTEADLPCRLVAHLDWPAP